MKIRNTMLSARSCLKKSSIIRQCLCHKTNYGANYSQRCDVDDCGCPIPQEKCKKRPKFVREVDCEKCIFESWRYKPRPKFVALPTQEEQRKEPRECSPIMKGQQSRNDKDEKKKAELCRNMNRTDADIGHCPESYNKDITSKACEVNPFKFEDENIPLPDWDFTKKRDVPPL